MSFKVQKKATITTYRERRNFRSCGSEARCPTKCHQALSICTNNTIVVMIIPYTSKLKYVKIKIL
jgi:hypothetical protein